MPPGSYHLRHMIQLDLHVQRSCAAFIRTRTKKRYATICIDEGKGKDRPGTGHEVPYGE